MTESALTQLNDIASRLSRCDQALMVFLLIAAIRGSEALAGEPASEAAKLPSHNPPLSVPSPYPSMFALTPHTFEASQNFSPAESHATPTATAHAEFPRDHGFSLSEPVARDRGFWQQLDQYKSQGRVRLLPLFETRATSLSLQSGRHGGPSLQWSSPWGMKSGKTTSGLFDRFISVHVPGSSSRSSPRATGPSVPTHSAELGPVAIK